ncbi:MAG TPA: DUF58 domain-containing protein [Blastocatellia bacterium]
MNRQAWRDFFITTFLLGLAFVIALLSSIAAEQFQPIQAAIAAAISLLLALLGALYIIPKLARNVRLEMLRLAIKTTITVEGLFFVVFLAIIGFAAWNTGNNLLYLVLSVMMAFLFAANLIARMSLANISIQLRFPDHIFAGEPANITVTVANHKRVIPSYSTLIEAVSDEAEKRERLRRLQEDDEEENQSKKVEGNWSPPPRYEIGKLAYFVLVPPCASGRLKVEHTFHRRGRYPITGFRISTKFPAGFLKKWRVVDATGEILVYPKPKSIDDFYHALPMLAGQIQSHTRGSGDDLYGLRRYQTTDHIRNIDWKATAKSGDLMVREHVREDEWRLTIVFDTSRPDEIADEEFEARFERAVEMAASLANHFILERSEVELITADERLNVASASGEDHLYKILRSLATLQPAARAESKPSEKKKSFFARFRRSVENNSETIKGTGSSQSIWQLAARVPVLADERRFKVLITPAPKGSIPANIWRSAHVVFMEDL